MTARGAGPPTPYELLAAPQLAVVALLEEALHVGRMTLIAAHGELLTSDGLDTPPETPAAWVALDALSLMTALAANLAHYRVSLNAEPRRRRRRR